MYHIYSKNDLPVRIENTPGETIHNFCERAVVFCKTVDSSRTVIAKACGKEVPVLSHYTADDLFGEFATILNLYTISEESKMEDKEPKLDIYNPEHYPDPTAYHGIKNAEREKRDNWISPEEFKELKDRHYKLIGCIFRICELSGFAVVNRIELRDKKTGKVWK